MVVFPNHLVSLLICLCEMALDLPAALHLEAFKLMIESKPLDLLVTWLRLEALVINS